MFRLALRALPRAPLASTSASASLRAVAAIRPIPIPSFTRTYAASAGLSKEDITSRVLDVLQSFEKVDGSKLTTTSAFTKDLGLDSLDAVEVVMAIEEEFGIEIPDAEADEITTVSQAIDYVLKTPEAH